MKKGTAGVRAVGAGGGSAARVRGALCVRAPLRPSWARPGCRAAGAPPRGGRSGPLRRGPWCLPAGTSEGGAGMMKGSAGVSPRRLLSPVLRHSSIRRVWPMGVSASCPCCCTVFASVCQGSDEHLLGRNALGKFPAGCACAHTHLMSVPAWGTRGSAHISLGPVSERPRALPLRLLTPPGREAIRVRAPR